MKLLVLAYKLKYNNEIFSMRSEVIEMPSDYSLEADSEYNRFDKLRDAFAEHVVKTGFYATEKAMWKDSRQFRIGAVSLIQ